MKGAEGEFESEFVDEADAEVTPASIKRLREKLKKAVEEKQEYLDGWQRARADFANYKKEEASLYQEKEERIKADFIEDLLPALDTIEMALQHNPTHELQLVHKQLLSSLKTAGVEQIGSTDGKDMLTGRPFNPAEHEALQEIEGPKEVEHAVVKVLRSGYKVGNRIIRPAQVAIGIVTK